MVKYRYRNHWLALCRIPRLLIIWEIRNKHFDSLIITTIMVLQVVMATTRILACQHHHLLPLPLLLPQHQDPYHLSPFAAHGSQNGINHPSHFTTHLVVYHLFYYTFTHVILYTVSSIVNALMINESIHMLSLAYVTTRNIKSVKWLPCLWQIQMQCYLLYCL